MRDPGWLGMLQAARPAPTAAARPGQQSSPAGAAAGSHASARLVPATRLTCLMAQCSDSVCKGWGGCLPCYSSVGPTNCCWGLLGFVLTLSTETHLASWPRSEVNLKRSQQCHSQISKVTPQPSCCCACSAVRPHHAAADAAATAAADAASRRTGTTAGPDSRLDCCASLGQQGVVWLHTLCVSAQASARKGNRKKTRTQHRTRFWAAAGLPGR